MKLSNLGSFLTPIVTIIRAKGVTNSLTHSLLGGDVIHGQPFSLIVYKRKKRCFIEIHGKTIFLILDSKLTFSSWFIYFVRHILIAQFLAIHDLSGVYILAIFPPLEWGEKYRHFLKFGEENRPSTEKKIWGR